ncbi:MAG: protease modulator HflK [Pedosphaera sp.]|nr:protease modulator HflK [Pedosphaera sp.]
MSDNLDHSPAALVGGSGGPIRPQPQPTPPREPEVAEDAGTQALSDALRSSFVIVKIIMVILVAIFFGSGVFTVPSQEQAIKLRFGRPVGSGNAMLLDPGLHWSFPYPIDEIVRIPTGQKTVRSTVGWFAITLEQEAAKEEPASGPSINPAADGYTITADANIIHVRATLNYRITDPLKYALNFVNASNMVQNALNNAIVHASVRTKVDDALRLERQSFQEKILSRVKELVVQQGLGIELASSTIEILPPRYMKEKFEEVNSADSERRQAVDKAHGEASRIESNSKAEAASIVNAGQIASTRLISNVRAEANYFLDQLPRYNANPSLFMARLQVDALHKVLTNAADKEFNGTDRSIRTLLSREPQKPPQAPQQ